MGIYDDSTKFLTDIFEEEIFSKLTPTMFGGKTMMNRVYGNIGSLGGGEYGYKKLEHMGKLQNSPNGLSEPIKVWANNGFGKGLDLDGFILKKSIEQYS